MLPGFVRRWHGASSTLEHEAICFTNPKTMKTSINLLLRLFFSLPHSSCTSSFTCFYRHFFFNINQLNVLWYLWLVDFCTLWELSRVLVTEKDFFVLYTDRIAEKQFVKKNSLINLTSKTVSIFIMHFINEKLQKQFETIYDGTRYIMHSIVNMIDKRKFFLKNVTSSIQFLQHLKWCDIQTFQRKT